MVAKAAWLTVEPDICLANFLAGEEPHGFLSPTSWLPEELAISEEDVKIRTAGNESPGRD